MKTTVKQPETSRVIQSKLNKQDSVSSILQRYKDKTVQLHTVQLKSKVSNTGQIFSWGVGNNEKTMVGKTMEAFIDPDDKLHGESANLNTDQDPMMHWIKSHHGIKASGAVKGHLLNDNLGGKALNVNLFPITKAANALHLRTAENFVKNAVWNHNHGIYYRVDATSGNPSTFTYKIQQWNPVTDTISGSVESNTIYSDLGSPNDMDFANQDDIELVKAEMSNAAAFKGNAAYHPATKVGDLNDYWRGVRERSGQISNLYYTSDDSEATFS
jgi:hypothetical protein